MYRLSYLCNFWTSVNYECERFIRLDLESSGRRHRRCLLSWNWVSIVLTTIKRFVFLFSCSHEDRSLACRSVIYEDIFWWFRDIFHKKCVYNQTTDNASCSHRKSNVSNNWVASVTHTNDRFRLLGNFVNHFLIHQNLLTLFKRTNKYIYIYIKCLFKNESNALCEHLFFISASRSNKWYPFI